MRLSKKRRIEAKTDYSKRIKLLKSNKPRLVFRKTNKYVIAQYVLSEEAQDKVLKGVTSKDLINYGWPKEMEGSLKSITASYLTGYLIGKEINKNKLEQPIIDLGMIRIMHKTKPFAFIKGLADSGITVQCDKKNFPEETRISGKNLKVDLSKTIETIKSNINKK